MNGQTRQRKGKVTTSPRAKAKVKARARKKHPGKGNHNQDQAGSPNEDGQRTLGDFGFKRQRVEFVGDVQQNDDFESPRLDRAAYVFCVQKCNSISMGSTELPSSSKRVCDGYEEPAGTNEKLDQSTGEVLIAVGCRDDRPIVDSGSVVSTCPVDYATSPPTEKVQYCMNLESVLGESLQHYCASFACSVTRSTTTEFQHNDIMMKTTVQNDLRLEMALESMWIICAHEKSNN